MSEAVRHHQDVLCTALAELEGRDFREDTWERDEGGGGRTRMIEEGDVFERAAVNVSVVSGELSPKAARAMGSGEGGVDDLRFWAAGLSTVVHPKNPHVPTFHANYRYFERGGEEEPEEWWFGGGSDLTPFYLYEEDARHFHRTLKEVCDAHDPEYYPAFKSWCDDYFYLDHREEARGVGGLFFDDLDDRPAEALFGFVTDLGDALVPAYRPIVERRMETPWGERQRRWQQLRRGRYVEFNLLYDRGTKFGLRTDGRTESILASMPTTARWGYDVEPDPDTPEAALMAVLREPQPWVET